jgi:hypothetical protein
MSPEPPPVQLHGPVILKIHNNLYKIYTEFLLNSFSICGPLKKTPINVSGGKSNLAIPVFLPQNFEPQSAVPQKFCPSDHLPQSFLPQYLGPQ